MSANRECNIFDGEKSRLYLLAQKLKDCSKELQKLSENEKKNCDKKS